MSDHVALSHWVNIRGRYTRAVNLAGDWPRPESLRGYVLTPLVAETLEQLRQALERPHGQRAFTLIGPYGTGKSAFTVFLCQLLGRQEGLAAQALEVLRAKHPELAEGFERLGFSHQASGAKQGFLTLAITARRWAFGAVLTEGLIESVRSLSGAAANALLQRLEAAQNRQDWKNTLVVLGFLRELSELAQEQGYHGVLLVIDEAGKTLEYALQDRENGDIHLCQEIAEFANRQAEVPLLFLLSLHQMFDDYVEFSARTIRNEWAKVQERFQPLQFVESAGAMIGLLASAIEGRDLPPAVTKAVKTALKALQEAGAKLPLGMSWHSFEQLALRAWPFHPTTLLAIPHLFRRLAQNERSIFSYLNSHEPMSFQAHLARPLGPDAGFIRLADLYTYWLGNYEATLARHPHAKRLLEAEDILRSRQTLTGDEFQLIRTVALLNVLGEMSTLRATLPLIACAAGLPHPEALLEQLKRQSLLTFRHFDSTYRVWEGSDVDLDERMKAAHKALAQQGEALLPTLRAHLPKKHFVARRHSQRTGAHRWFVLEYTEANLLEASPAPLPLGVAGRIVVLLPLSDAPLLRHYAEKLTLADPQTIIALPRQLEKLRSALHEVAALRWVQSHTEALRDDRVARRELSLRLAEGQQQLAQNLRLLLDPRPAPWGDHCLWIWQGQAQAVSTPRQVMELLSRVCDELYPFSPCIRNELIARNSLSTAASAARRSLLESMLREPSRERLGIQKFPPESSMYESVLRAGGLHAYDPALGTWGFYPPSAGAPLRPAWEALEQLVFEAPGIQRPVHEIFGILAQRPYGVPWGVLPVLLLAFYQVYADELFFYREKTFVPEPQLAFFELLAQRPARFTLSGARLEGMRLAVVERLAKGLGTAPKTAAVVRSLYQRLGSLPPLTLQSNKLAAPAAALRQVFQQASSPEALLFHDLPQALGQPNLGPEAPTPAALEAYFNALNSALKMLAEFAPAVFRQAQDQLLKACGLPTGAPGWAEALRRAQWLTPRLNHSVLTPLLKSMLNGKATQDPRPALACVATRACEQWQDADCQRFPGLAEGYGQHFRQAWRDFGDGLPELTPQEQLQKEAVRQQFAPQIKALSQSHQKTVLCAALRELLRELEHDLNSKPFVQG